MVGLGQAATPLVFWWLNSVTVYALGLVLIASVYVGFAVADGPATVITLESGVTLAFVTVPAAAPSTTCWSTGIPLAVTLTGGNRNDVTYVAAVRGRCGPGARQARPSPASAPSS